MTVIPSPKVQVGLGKKFVPVRETLRFAPWAAEFGLTPVSDGGGLMTPATTLKPLLSVLDCPSGLVTVMERGPVAALKTMLILAVSSVGET